MQVSFAFVSCGECNKLHWYIPRVLWPSSTKLPATHTQQSNQPYTPANVRKPSCAFCSWTLGYIASACRQLARQRASVLWINKDTCNLIWSVLLPPNYEVTNIPQNIFKFCKLIFFCPCLLANTGWVKLCRNSGRPQNHGLLQMCIFVWCKPPQNCRNTKKNLSYNSF